MKMDIVLKGSNLGKDEVLVTWSGEIEETMIPMIFNGIGSLAGKVGALPVITKMFGFTGDDEELEPVKQSDIKVQRRID